MKHFKPYKRLTEISGFSKDLEFVKLKNEIISHVTDLEGLSHLLKNYNSSDNVCFSTKSGSKKYIFRGGDYPVRIEMKGNFEGYYTPYDADAGKYYGYDEFRLYFKNKENFIKEIDTIYVSQDTYNYLAADEDETYDGTDEKREWFFDEIYTNFFNKIEIVDNVQKIKPIIFKK